MCNKKLMPVQADSDGEWVPEDRFDVLPTEPVSGHVEEDDNRGEAHDAKGMPVLVLPDRHTIEQHKLTHLPYRNWCPACVRGKAIEARHQKNDSRNRAVPILQLDYTFINTEDQASQETIITAIVTKTGYATAIHCSTKGSNDEYVMRQLERFLNEIGFTGQIIIQTDPENSIQDVAQALARKREERLTEVRTCPVGSKGSNGSVERYHRSLQAQIRTLKSQLEDEYGDFITSRSIIVPWMIRHAAWLLCRYNIGPDGKSPFERQKLYKFISPLAGFGEIVYAKGVTRAKLESRWVLGVWLGRTADSNCHIVGTDRGILKTRTIKRQPRERQHVKDVLNKMKGLPWSPTAASWEHGFEDPMIERPQPKEGGRDADKDLKKFLEAFGKTRGCKACEQPHGNHHTRECRLRRDEFRFREALREHEEKVAEQQQREQQSQESRQLQQQRQQQPDDALHESGQVREREREGDDEPQRSSKRSKTSEEVEDVLDDVNKRTRPIEEEDNEQRLKKKRVGNLMNYLIGRIDEECIHETCEEGETECEFIDGMPADKVKAGMDKEMDQLSYFEVYDEVPIEQVGSEEIWSTRWVHRLRGDEVRSRLVVRQFNNSMREDVYAGTPTPSSIRILLYVAVLLNLPVNIGDFCVAFMQSKVKENIFVMPPKEFRREGFVWKLKKSMNGIRRASQNFQDFICEVLVEKMGFKRCKTDGSIFVHPNGKCFVGIHVDDYLLVGSDQDRERFQHELAEHVLFKIGPIINHENKVKFLGRNYQRTEQGFKVSAPEGYVDETLNIYIYIYNMKSCKGIATPGSKTEDKDEHENLDAEEHRRYRQVVGKLQFLCHDRPDLQYSVKELARKLNAPTTGDRKRAKRVLRYLQHSRDFEMHLSIDNQCTGIKAWVDSDWAGCVTSRKSSSGGIITVNGFTIMTFSRTQSIVAQSSAEAELYAISAGACETLYCKSLLNEIGFTYNIEILSDSKAGRAIAQRHGVGKTRHIEIKHLFVQDLISKGLVSVKKVRSDDNISDIGTKYLDAARFENLRMRIGIR